MPPIHIRAREFKRDENIVEVAKERKEKRKASSSRKVPIVPSIQSWKWGFINIIKDFKEDQDMDNIVKANIVSEIASEAAKDDKTQKQKDTTLSTTTHIQIYVPGRQIERLLR